MNNQFYIIDKEGKQYKFNKYDYVHIGDIFITDLGFIIKSEILQSNLIKRLILEEVK